MKKIPESITVNTGEQEKVQKTIDDFFSDSMKGYYAKNKPNPKYFKIESYELSSRGIESDNRVTYLRYKNDAIAVVMETRTEFNHVHYDFFRNI